MYATKRSVNKAQGVEKKGKEPEHNNGKITDGREHRVQIIKDAHGFIKKRIVHYSPRKLEKIQKYKKLLEEYKAAELEAQKAQFEGENDVKGMDSAPVEEPAKETIATE